MKKLKIVRAISVEPEIWNWATQQYKGQISAMINSFLHTLQNVNATEYGKDIEETQQEIQKWEEEIKEIKPKLINAREMLKVHEKNQRENVDERRKKTELLAETLKRSGFLASGGRRG